MACNFDIFGLLGGSDDQTGESGSCPDWGSYENDCNDGSDESSLIFPPSHLLPDITTDSLSFLQHAPPTSTPRDSRWSTDYGSNPPPGCPSNCPCTCAECPSNARNATYNVPNDRTYNARPQNRWTTYVAQKPPNGTYNLGGSKNRTFTAGRAPNCARNQTYDVPCPASNKTYDVPPSANRTYNVANRTYNLGPSPNNRTYQCPH